MKKIAIIGSGFSALASACYLAKEGNDVTIYEKNGDVGGRARRYQKDGFTFDIGPTFYWMPDVFERFFNDFGKKQRDYYTIDRLNPGYEVYFGIKDSFKISSDVEEIVALFEEEESGAGDKLRAFLKQAQDNYDIAVKDIVYKPGVSPLELVTPETIARLHLLLTNIQGQIRRKIKSKKLRKVLEFPVLFLGAKPSNTPALYNFMNWADFGLGTWHPRGGMYSVVLGIKKLAEELGVKFETNANVEQIILEKDSATGLRIRGNQLPADIILSGADYHHTE
ncbi:UNVERIFIED_CONTAM: hypothetical protein GTU68_053436, partial [Idotea baltica]|nr:hypothetical protein [Idotea baltica]